MPADEEPVASAEEPAAVAEDAVDAAGATEAAPSATVVAEHRRGARGSVSRWRAPERTCVGCRGKAPKVDAAPRRARRATARSAVDPSRSAPGRGAYVHRGRGVRGGRVRGAGRSRGRSGRV